MRYQESIISKTDFMKTIEEKKDHEKMSYQRNHWKTWRNKRFDLANYGAGAGPNAGGGFQEVSQSHRNNRSN